MDATSIGPPAPRRALAGLLGVVLTLALAASGCSSGKAATSGSPRVRLYTSVTQETVDAVVKAFEAANPGVGVEVYRAPTGELNGRIASEQRAGGVKADVIWATDPLSMHAWDAQGLLATDFSPDLSAIPPQYRPDDFWGTRVLHLVIVEHTGLTPAPVGWHDLTDPAYRDAVEIPDPAFAGSAFAALGYFAEADGFGMDFYRQLKANGATQVSSPADVVTDVAEGRAKLGITLDFSANDAAAKGSPVAAVWPQPGAIAVYSPIGLFRAAPDRASGESFIRFVLSPAGQRTIAASGWQPVLAGLRASPAPPGGGEVFPDWATVFDHQAQLLQQYRAIFGG